MERQQIIDGLNCFKSHQHKCADCSWNPHPGTAWPYGCIKGQIDIAEAAQELLMGKKSAIENTEEGADLISRSELLAAYDAAHKGPPGGARKLIEEAPSINAEQEIRCKDCIYWAEWYVRGEKRYCEKLDHYTYEDFFCAYGEEEYDV